MEQTKKKSSRSKSRSYPKPIERALYAYAGGRCEFKGCNKYLLAHPISLRDGNFAEKAHIRPFSPSGPRADASESEASINDVGNLMLLCDTCHKEVDGRPSEYPVEILKQYKNDHEERVHHVTGLGPEYQTKVLVLKANIAGQLTSASDDDVYAALFPDRWASKKPADAIDLTSVLDLSGGYPTFSATIREFVQRFYADKPGHVSVFAIGPMALLMELGSQMSNKISTDFFQLHRDTKNWRWKNGGEIARYSTTRIREGTDRTKIALVISLSGTIDLAAIPAGEEFSVYLLTLEGSVPNPGFLQTRDDLNAFREEYKRCIAQIAADRPGTKEIHLFPAMPAPVAVVCGHDLPPKSHPSLIIYDYDKAIGGFREVHKVNHHV